MRIFIGSLLVTLICSDVQARPRHKQSSMPVVSKSYSMPTHFGQNVNRSYTNLVTQSDQEQCQKEANYMAQNNITGHVWGCIGSFEGVGYGPSPNCETCKPSSNMVLTGDASAQGKNGMWYRVRSWR